MKDMKGLKEIDQKALAKTFSDTRILAGGF
jgi:hypothetical protein